MPDKGAIAILGSGLAGLLASKALRDNGIQNYHVFTDEFRRPKMMGFHVLHVNCGLSLETEEITVVQYGSKDEYQKKRGKESSCSWGKDTVYSIKGFNPYKAWNLLANQLPSNKLTEAVYITKDRLDSMLEGEEFSLVINTLSSLHLFPEMVKKPGFKQYRVSINEERSLSDNSNGNFVIYSGYSGDNWSRRGVTWGRGWTESSGKLPNYTDKPDGLNVEELGLEINPKMIMTGRLARWDKTEMAHDTYFRICGMIRNGSIPILWSFPS